LGIGPVDDRMTAFPIQPLMLLFYGLALICLGALVQLARNSRRRQSTSYSLTALTWLGCLDVMAFLGGFSIGPLLILIASPVAIVLALSVHTHRRPVGLLALATLLLASGMWTTAFGIVRQILTLGLALGALVAVLQLSRTWRSRGSGLFAGWGITLCSCLGGLSLLLGSTPGGPWSAVPLLAAGLGLGLALAARRFRTALVLIALANLLLGLSFLA
jgi:hypothetical protein